MGLKGTPMRLEPIANPSLARRAGFPAMALAATVLVASALALIAGASPQGVALAALKPVRAKTRANAARLARRGPGAPT